MPTPRARRRRRARCRARPPVVPSRPATAVSAWRRRAAPVAYRRTDRTRPRRTRAGRPGNEISLPRVWIQRGAVVREDLVARRDDEDLHAVERQRRERAAEHFAVV